MYAPFWEKVTCEDDVCADVGEGEVTARMSSGWVRTEEGTSRAEDGGHWGCRVTS